MYFNSQIDVFFTEGNIVVICRTFVDGLYIYISYAHCIQHIGSSLFGDFASLPPIRTNTVPTALD